MTEKTEVLIPEEKVNDRIREMGEEISRDYAGEEVHLISVLKGGVFITTELAKRISVPVSMDFMCVSSYSGTESTGVVKIVKDLDEPISGKNVIVVEDIMDTGRTLSYLLDLLRDRHPKSLKLCTLLDKPDRRVTEVQADYTGFVVPDKFIVGYGLDYNQKYRNLPFVGVLSFEE